ncbi:hypothetical protein GCM10009555_060430 [Acrocarpospora macrocephala]|uniref:Bacterial bifunctional deaminase-reductase C-terminal domain-containing protein n=1 Tax=Acrocarpospora macrocephala TaxID=150177 RepID=A0A5M3WS06_9ACTN|nr:hypothetical protein Amac_036880 [Acrocarpospora macrocephala]
MSLDGFVAGPNHEMDWMMTGISPKPGLIEGYVATTGAVLGGWRGWDHFPDPRIVYGGADTARTVTLRERRRITASNSAACSFCWALSVHECLCAFVEDFFHEGGRAGDSDAG